MNGRTLLSPDALGVADRVIAEESARRAHVVVYLSGAHAYGFPSPDSDLDLKAIHVASTRELLGFGRPQAGVDRMEVLDGVEIDYTSNELGHALSGILRGNGNFIERVAGKATLCGSPWLEELRQLVIASLSRRAHAHYRGFSHSQLHELEARPTVKALLYVLRTALTGIHLLRSGQLVVDVNELLDEYGLGEARSLVAQKRAGERSPLGAEQLEAWRARASALLERLEKSRESSPLPESPPNEAELEDWLVRVRTDLL